MAPPENGEEGSTASTPTRPPSARTAAISRSVRVDLPAPGRAGDADDVVDVGARAEGELADLASRLAAPLDQGEQPAERTPCRPARAASSSAAGSRRLGGRGLRRSGRTGGTVGAGPAASAGPVSAGTPAAAGARQAGAAAVPVGSQRCVPTWTSTRWWS